MLGILAEKFENNDMTDIDKLYEKLQKIADNVRVQYVSVGEKSEYIKFFVDRLGSEQYNLMAKQTRLEGLDLAEGITKFANLELAYNACLQIGTKILQPSLLDFLK
jgi:flagellar hook-associated protein 3 FlgL